MFKYLVNKYFLLKRRLSSFLQGQTAILKFLIFNVWELNLWLKVTFPFVKPTRISHLKKSNSFHNSTLVMIYFLVKVHWYAVVKVIWIVFSRLVLLRLLFSVLWKNFSWWHKCGANSTLSKNTINICELSMKAAAIVHDCYDCLHANESHCTQSCLLWLAAVQSHLHILI